MAYALGIDLGTTYSAAATSTGDRVEVFTLGSVAPVIPSVVVLRADGEVLVGEAAERRSITEPTRTGREFKRRLGDPAPLVLGGTPYGAEALMARLLRAIVDAVTERQGAPPDRIVVTHPANYGAYKKDLLREMVRLGDVSAVDFLTEPEAAAINYAQQNRLEPGQIVAVYDFGGGTFDAAVLRKTADSFELLGQPEGMERLGGIDFDQAIFAHVDDAVGGQISEADAGDPMTRAALARLRADVRSAKESLSTDTDVTIPVMLPGLQTDVRLTRTEFEAMIRPRLAETVAALERAVRSAGISMDQVDKILLVGGSSRIPLVAETVRAATGRPVAVDAHPKFAIALGAARAGAAALVTIAAPPSAVTGPAPHDVAAMASPATAAPPPSKQGGGASTLAQAVAPIGPADMAGHTPPIRRRSRAPLLAGAGAAVLLLGGGAIALAMLGGGAGDGVAQSSPGQTPQATASAAPSATATAPPAATPAPTVANTSTPGAAVDGGIISTFAGSPSEGYSGDGGPPLTAQFSRTSGVAVAPDGAVYIADYQNSNVRVVRDGVIETLAEDLVYPQGIAVDDAGNVYVADTSNHRVVRIGPTGEMANFAGTPELAGPGGDGGPATEAQLSDPYDVAVDGDGNVYIADSKNHRVRVVEPSGIVRTLAGTGPAGDTGDGGPADEATLNLPRGVAVDGEGNVYIADHGNGRIRRVDPSGIITTIAGNGETGPIQLPTTASALEIPLWSLEDVEVDTQGRVLVAPGGQLVRIDPESGQAHVLGGQGDSELDQIPVAEAYIGDMWGIGADPQTGDIYLANSQLVRVVRGIE